MSHIHLKIYNNDNDVNQCYRISPRRKNNNFNVNDYVKNNDNLYGIIQNKNDNYMVINWNDNTYERLQIPLIDKNYLIRISKKEYFDNNSNNNINSADYVDTIETQVSPLQISTINTASIQNNSTQNVPIQNNIEENNIVKVSKNIPLTNDNSKVMQLINLALDKGIIDSDEVETEKLKLTAFDDKALKQYEEMLNNTSDDGEVTSLSESNIDTSGLSPQEAEAQNMLHKLKHQRGISTSRQRNININDTSSRSLKDMEKTIITYANTNNGQFINNSQISLDDSLLRALNEDQSNSYNQNNIDNNQYADNYNNINSIKNDNDNIDIENNNFKENNFKENNFKEMSLDSIVEQIQQDNKSSFLKTPFNGLTKPLLINTSDNINPVNTAFRELFSPDMFTSIGKR